MSTRVPLSISKTVHASIQGVHRGTVHPKEVNNHHEPLTPRSKQSPGLFKRTSEGAVMFSRRVFSGEGATENFRVILN